MRDPTRMVIRKPDANSGTAAISEDSLARSAVYDDGTGTGERIVVGSEQG
jgi:hypothetical protein